MTLRPDHDGIADNNHGFQEGLLLPEVNGVVEIKGGHLGLGFVLDIDEAALKNLLIIRHPLQGGTVGRRLGNNELGFQAALVNVRKLTDFSGEHLVQMFVEGLALPVGGDFFHDDVEILGRNLEGALVAVVQVADHFAVKVTVYFRIEDTVTAKLADAAREKLIRSNPHSDLLGYVFQGLGPAEGEELAFRLLHALSEPPGALNINERNSELVSFKNLVDTLTAPAVDFLVDDAVFLRGKDEIFTHYLILQKRLASNVPEAPCACAPGLRLIDK